MLDEYHLAVEGMTFVWKLWLSGLCTGIPVTDPGSDGS